MSISQKISVLLFLPFLACNNAQQPDKNAFQTLFESSNGLESAAYNEGISYWKKLDSAFQELNLLEFGSTDAGYPLHLAILSDKEISLDEVQHSDKAIILINNAIHPGEPDGVDASMMLFRDLLFDEIEADLLDSVILVCIPYYNIGGALNRNTHSRTNQDGPLEYGFRGNAQNLDLNRDFIKCDSKNALSFTRLLQELDPDIYIETHVSNGADYQYTMTYLSTQADKLGFGMGKILREILVPELESKMNSRNDAMVPYVNHFSGPLDSSYYAFYDTPRYSTGLTSLHQVYGFITETHMLKPFRKRVLSTYNFLLSTLELAAGNKSQIKKSRAEARKMVSRQTLFHLDWGSDSTISTLFPFAGYAYFYEKSAVSGADRLKYDRTQPLIKPMKYYGWLKPIISRNKPRAYIVKHGYHEVMKRLKANGISYSELIADTTIRVCRYRILNYETSDLPYEKHYLHSRTKFEADTLNVHFLKGDYLIEMGSRYDRLLVELLEPDGPDSYFNWNFFDAILQQKEWYSAYVFEDKAAKYLASDSKLKQEFDSMKLYAPGFTDNPGWQLYWVYQHSLHYEKEHMILPVFRIE